MKKLFVLTLLVGLALSFSITVNASSFTYNDMPQASLNGHSLNEVFRDNNLNIENDFNTCDVWGVRPDTTKTCIDSILTLTASSTSTYVGVVTKLHDRIIPSKMYVIARLKSDRIDNYIAIDQGTSLCFPTLDFEQYSTLYNVASGDNIFRVMQSLTAGQSYYFDYLNIYNLTALGIIATKDTMDLKYQEYINHADGYTLVHDPDKENPLTILEKLWGLLLSWSGIIMDFLFQSQTLGFEGITILGAHILDFSITFIPFYAIGGGTAVTFLLLYLGKLFIPML